MRNLKKILALVLALVMSLSLMATAGAKDFGDSDQVNANYKTAIDVLSELKVFGGYDDGTFKPQQNITRAEVAAIIYRIATGDVMGDKVALYSDMTNSKLADLNQAEWARGQINYCYNAGIIKGVNNTDFEPNANVTGYAALTMILRALGYGQNGEFVGDQWEMNTASRARELGLLDKISEGQLGAPATREMVAEILFRTMLKETVTWTALQGYQTTGTTLGYKTFQLRDVTGVVTANKWANLYGESVLADEQTNVILTGEEKATRIAIDTELTDIGEARHFYLTGAVGAKEATFIAYDQEGVTNNTYSNAGAAKDVSTNSKFSNVTGITKDANTEQFINFGYATEGKSDYRLEYQVVFDNSADYTYDGKTSQEWFADKYGVDPADVLDNANRFDTITTVGTVTTYTRVIPRGDGISAADIAIMDGVFSVADNDDSKSAGIDGYVYAGTNSTSSVDRNLDLSDEMNWNEFYDTYIASRANTVVDGVENGEWLKVVDNNNDGVAEYVFMTEFWMDEALNTYTLKGETYLDYYKLDEHSDDYDVRYIDEINVGDVVVYTKIDGKANVCLAEPVPATVQDVLYKTVEIVTTEDDTKGQSGITNDTEMDDNILNMADKTEYNLYLDEFGFVRAYKLPGGTQYGLVTEAYYGFGQNGAFVQNNKITVELGLGEEELTEYSLSNAKDNELVAPEYYSLVEGKNNIDYHDYLQPAVAHLGTEDAFVDEPDVFGANFSHVWGKAREVRTITTPATAANNEWPTFDYHNFADLDGTLNANPAGADIDHYASMTNIAVVSGLTDDSVALNGAAKYAYDKTTGERLYRVYDADTTGGVDGTVAGHFKLNEKVTQEEWEKAYIEETKDTENARTMFEAYLASEDLIPVYAVDYIQLDRSESIAKGDRHYEIDDHNTVNTSYKALNNNYVNAIHDTQYYIVGKNGHSYFTDYANVTAIDASNILAAYAVARDTNADKDGVPYWVADVIVIEVKDWDELNLHSISLAYFEPRKSSDRVHYVETLNNESEDPMLTIVEKEDWGNNWKTGDYGFYQLYNAEMDGDELLVGSVDHITKGDYNKNGIYAGTFLRTRTINNKGGYVDVQLNASLGGDYVGQPEVPITMAPIYTIDSNSATEISWSSVDVGDHLIFVVDLDKEVTKFVIHLGTDTTVDYLVARPKTPAWLWSDYAEISEEQGWTGGDPENVECLIDAANWLLDDDAEPTLYQLTESKAALTKITTPGNGYKLTPAQLAEITTAVTGLIPQLTTAIATAEAAADAAEQTAAKKLADKRAEGYTDYTVVGANDGDGALKALYDAIEADVTTVYDGVKLIPTATEVADLDAAIAVAKDGEKAIAAAKALIKEKNGTDDMTLYPNTKAAYDALEAAIKAVADADALEDIYADNALVEGQAEVDALIAVLPETAISEDDAALTAAIAEAKGKIDSAFGITAELGEVAEVAAAKTALETALEGCETAEALAEFYNTSTKKFVVTNENEAKALKEAVDAAKVDANIAAAVAALNEATLANAVIEKDTAADATDISNAIEAVIDDAIASGMKGTVAVTTSNPATGLTVGHTGKDIEFTVAVVDTAEAGTAVDTETLSIKVLLYYTADKAKTDITAALSSVEDSVGNLTDGGAQAAVSFEESVKTKVKTVAGVVEDSISVTITGTPTWEAAQTVNYSVSYKYGTSNTAVTIDGQSVTLQA